MPDPAVVFAYERVPIVAEIGPIEARDGYDLMRVTYPSYHQGETDDPVVVAWFYRQRSAAFGNVVVLPILGGDYTESRIFSEYFAKRGLNVLRFERKSRILDASLGLDRTRDVVVATVVDVRRGLDWWLTNPEVDGDRLGVCGISMGAFQASLLMAVDDRLDAGVFLLNGGDFPELVVRSEEEDVTAFRTELMQKTGWTSERLHREAAIVLRDVDPLTYAPRLNPSRILTIQPRFDHVVPFELAQRWYEAAGRPHRVILPTGHYSAILAIGYAERVSIAHFRKMFGAPMDR